MKPKRLDQGGFTLVELLTVISIIAILGALLLLLNPIKQVNKGYDSVRKKDLNNIKRVFEDYYSDHLCYPAAGILDSCGGSQLLPYLSEIPCDPQTKQPYLYVPEADNCSGYRVLTILMDKTDPYITLIGCSPVSGCGVGSADYNYGISSPGISVAVATPTPTPTVTTTPTSTPTPTTPTRPPPSFYACAPTGICNVYADPPGSGCPTWYAQPDCNNQCGNPANWCAQ